MKEIGATELAEEKMRSCGLKEEACGMNAVDKESEFTQPQDGLPCGRPSRSRG